VSGLFPEPPRHPPPEERAAVGPLGGPTFAYRGAIIECLKGGHVCTLRMATHPLDGSSFGVVGTIVPLIDLWLDESRLPDYMRAVVQGGPQSRPRRQR
jgi:hypothetical protein